jgi:hypothetical protein
MKPSWIATALVTGTLATGIAACATPPAPAVRFLNVPPVSAVNDRHDVPDRPAERGFFVNLYHYDAILQRPLDRTLELQPSRRALAVNALDEVPDSTWFTNRIGIRDLTLDELTTGPLTIDSPELHKPWQIKSTKVGGGEVGFIIEDARREKFLLKFDGRGYPETETATHVIVGKLLWACGYNITEDFVVSLTRDDLVIGHGAVTTDQFGDKHPLTRAELERGLALIEVGRDGRIRGMASRWLDGKPLGGHPGEGVRADDPNDRIPHELRRDLRGAYPMFAWLDHVDVQESNFIDMWVQDRRDPKLHYVKHYLIDFGKSFGVMATTGQDPRRGHAYVIDLAEMSRQLVTGGLLERPWDGRTAPPIRGLGLFETRSYDPGAWKPDYPVYAPFLSSDRIDKFWGAKLLIRFTREQLHAIVETGRFTDPRAVEYITDTLVARQRATAAHWFAQVNPLDRFAATGDQLCFDDLSIVYHFASAATTRYKITRYDRDARVLGAADADTGNEGRACTPLALASDGDGYTMLRIETTRPGFTGTTFVHLARDPRAGAPRVIGIWRP